jgi:hypothetical protein
MMDRVMALATPPTPGVPSCFAEDTPIELADGTVQPIKNIQIGDLLKNGSRVTAVSKLSSTDQHIYKLNNVLVSGEHRVFSPLTKWIKVKDHYASIHIPEFNEPYLYCLNTDSKEFTINETIFSDWDDIDESVLEKLEKNAVSVGHLPPKFTLADIHTHLDSGFHPSTPIVLINGDTTPISKIQVNDVLQSGDKVLGVFQIDVTKVTLYKYSFGDISIRATRNIHIDDCLLGKVDGMSLTDKHLRTNMPTPSASPTTSASAYHLLTNTGFLTIHNIRFNDYNYAIDKYLCN